MVKKTMSLGNSTQESGRERITQELNHDLSQSETKVLEMNDWEYRSL